jgi:hydroxypyruvate reductase
VNGIEPAHLVRSALARGALGGLAPQQIFLVSAGKAAWPMACAFVAHQQDRLGPEGASLARGVVAGPRVGSDELPIGIEWLDAGHPSPNASSEDAGRRALALASQSGTNGLLLVLLSGGASALMAVPADGLTLSDKIETSRALMNAGVAIADLNCVRKHLSAIKGGRLAAVARRTVTFAISDVHGPTPDDPAVIGSGPTVADPTTYADARAIVTRAGLAGIPASVASHLERAESETPKPGDPRLAASSFEVIGNRQMAMKGAADAARALGYAVRVLREPTSGEARETGAAFVASALGDAGISRRTTAALPFDQPICIIASGETTVHVRGPGRGGRNQEFALAAVPLIDSTVIGDAVAVLASAGTDGIDGPTDAAGAIVDPSSAARAQHAGLKWDAALAQNGAYDFFQPLGDLITWGPTGTNVGDIHVMLIDRASAS